MAWIKLVPEKEPNAKGTWVEVPMCRNSKHSFTEAVEQLSNHVPQGMFVVSLSSRKPENYD